MQQPRYDDLMCVERKVKKNFFMRVRSTREKVPERDLEIVLGIGTPSVPLASGRNALHQYWTVIFVVISIEMGSTGLVHREEKDLIVISRLGFSIIIPFKRYLGSPKASAPEI